MYYKSELLETGESSTIDGEDSVNRIIEYLRSYSKALLRKMGVFEEGRLRHGTPRRAGRPPRVERRREARSPRISPCTYGFMQSVDRDGVVLEEGHGTAVNDSPTGVRLLLCVAPSNGQILEIHTVHMALGYAICLVEVCWTKLLRNHEGEALYLVGCRRSFGPVRSEATYPTRTLPDTYQ